MHALLILAALLAHQPEQAAHNLLVNPSFEEPVPPEQKQPVNPHILGEWWSFTGPEKPYWRHFEIDDTIAHDGERSVRLTLDSTNWGGPTLIVGATQNVKAEAMPDELSGFVRVSDWQRGTTNQYVQIVVIVWNVSANLPAGLAAKNYQIAYTFAGIEAPPFAIANRKFQFPRGELVSLQGEDGEPIQGEWVRFDLNPRADFLREWGVDPSDFEYIRVLYEVRYDGRKPGSEPHAKALVHWDDLYFGPRREAEASE